MTVTISRVLLDTLLAEAGASPDVEICGLLLGCEARIAAALPAANIAADPARRFEIDPRVLFAAHRSARAGGPQVIGHYHSHPSGRPEPSACDAAAALSNEYWLILSGGTARLFRAVTEGPIAGRFDPVDLTN